MAVDTSYPRIIFVINSINSGGKERQLVEILRYLTQNGIIVGVVTFSEENDYDSTVGQYAAYYKKLAKRPTRLEPVFTIWPCFAEFKPDLIHTWDSLSSFYSFLPSFFLRIKLIDGSIRDAGVDNGIFYWFKRFFLRNSDLVVSNSNAGLKYYNLKGEVLYNSIDTSRFSKPDYDSDDFNIIMTANFTDYKDQLTFIKAAIILKNEGFVDNIYLAGSGPNLEKFKGYIIDKAFDIKASFHFIGSVNNIETYLAKCKVGVLCSTSKYGEGVSNSVLEYMAAGLVAIGTNIGGTSEIIEDGINGFLTNEGDSESIVAIVKKVKTDENLFREITQNAKNTITEKFSYEKNCGKIVNLYRKLCTEK